MEEEAEAEAGEDLIILAVPVTEAAGATIPLPRHLRLAVDSVVSSMDLRILSLELARGVDRRRAEQALVVTAEEVAVVRLITDTVVGDPVEAEGEALMEVAALMEAAEDHLQGDQVVWVASEEVGSI